MNSTHIRRTVAIVGVAATITIAGNPTSVASGRQDPAQDRPCFMVRAHWNTAEGPQPTCPVPTWQRATTQDSGTAGSRSGDVSGAARPGPGARIADFMP